MKYLFLLLLAGCGAQNLPVTETLTRLRASAADISDARNTLADVAKTICQDPAPELASRCSDVERALAQSESYINLAKGGLDLADEVLDTPQSKN